MFQTSESTKAITAALLDFQGHVSGVKRDGSNPHFRSKYATLENVIDTARPVLQECGISFVQAPGAIVDGALEVTTRLTHAKSGEWIQSTMHMPLGKRDPQGAGSATTYGLRYSLMAMLGLPPTDDDGEAAMDRSPQSVGAAATPKRQTGYRTDGTRTPHSLRKEGVWEEYMADLEGCATVAAVNKVALAWATTFERDFNEEWRENAREEIRKHKEHLLNGGTPQPHPLEAG